MKANELRIGNLVNYGVNIVPIKSIHTESVLKNEVRVYVELNEKLQNYCLDITEIEPIPLTEERLLKFGFELDIEDDGYQKGKYKVSVSDEGCLFFINIGYYPEEIAEFKYVHQLQNLYFALTGGELVVKE